MKKEQGAVHETMNGSLCFSKNMPEGEKRYIAAGPSGHLARSAMKLVTQYFVYS